MNIKLPLALLVAAGLVGGSAAIATGPAPALPGGDDFWAGTHWDDDDDDDRRVRRAMPRPDAEALRRAGMVKVREVERDDGRLEVEGYDASGRELEIDMDGRGKRILSVRHDDDDWDD